MHQVGTQLQSGCDCFYTPFYTDGFLDLLGSAGFLDFTAAFGKLRQKAIAYLQDAELPIDDRGERYDYDLVVTCTDIVIQRNLRGRKIVLVQEGITEPEGLVYHIVKSLRLPRFLANTAAFGLSDAYEYLCVASPGYRDLFVAKGVRPEKVLVTGVPNFDNVAAYHDSDFPHEGFVLVATTNARETFKRENRREFIRRSLEIADGRPVVFKLHPAEKHERAEREIRRLAPDAIIYKEGNIHEMIAKCDVLVAGYSTVTLTAAAMGKEIHSTVDPEELKRLVPIQNGGTSAAHIAEVCRSLLARNPDSGLKSDLSVRQAILCAC
jgi:hypothetical protein